jgi:nicotinate-nucleotide adenylyltransferase
MSTLWFGGSFNPIHCAHLLCARAVAESLNFDKVCLIPTHQPPHKPVDDAVLAPPEHRLAMCRLAIEGSDLFELDDLELHRQGRSYTIDTVRELRRRGHADIHWLIGADMVEILPFWHESAALLAETRFVIVARPGWEMEWDLLPPSYRFLKSNVVVAPLLDISATGIRRRVAEGKSIDCLAPEKVARYIQEHNLYQARASG